jgi:hypothetical protein
MRTQSERREMAPSPGHHRKTPEERMRPLASWKARDRPQLTDETIAEPARGGAAVMTGRSRGGLISRILVVVFFFISNLFYLPSDAVGELWWPRHAQLPKAQKRCGATAMSFLELKLCPFFFLYLSLIAEYIYFFSRRRRRQGREGREAINRPASS